MILKEHSRLGTMTGPKKVAEIMQAILDRESEIDTDKEHLWAIGLDNSNKIKYIELVCLGILNASTAHPREIFRLAIMKGVASIVICHNHPAGTLEPSPEDHKLTEIVKQSGDIIGIELLDHVIIGNGETRWYSFRSETSIWE